MGPLEQEQARDRHRESSRLSPETIPQCFNEGLCSTAPLISPEADTPSLLPLLALFN